MQAPTKKRPTETAEIRAVGPKAKLQEALEALRRLGFVDTTDPIPWREAFPEAEAEPSSNVALRGARTKEGLTQAELAEMTGIPQGHISRMENGKMAIGKARAKRLSQALNIDYRLFL